MAKMNKKIKEKWLKALRSGKFKATREHLKDKEGHCCLGVLCEVMGVGYKGSSASPSVQTLEKAGITKCGAEKLAELNDVSFFNDERDFASVIKVISRNF